MMSRRPPVLRLGACFALNAALATGCFTTEQPTQTPLPDASSVTDAEAARDDLGSNLGDVGGDVPSKTDASTGIADGNDASSVDSGDDASSVDSGDDASPVDSGDDASPVDSGDDASPVDSGAADVPPADAGPACLRAAELRAAGTVAPQDPGALGSPTPSGDAANGRRFVGTNCYACNSQTYDVTENFDALAGLQSSYQNLVPGMLLQGRSVQRGTPTELPLPEGRRGPVTLRISLPLANPTVTVANPTAANLAAAVSRLRLDAAMQFPAGSLPVNFTHTTEEVFSAGQASLSLGVSASYSDALFSAGINTLFEMSTRYSTRFFTMKHIEEAYTISVDGGSLEDERALLGCLTREELDNMIAAGVVAADNPPLFVDSVTFGRLALATGRAENQVDSTVFNASISAAGGGASVSVADRNRYSALASSARWSVVAVGATTEEATRAFREDRNTSTMFGALGALSAAPVYSRTRFVQGERLPFRVGSTTRYTVDQCNAAPTGTGGCPAGWTPAAYPGNAALNCTRNYDMTYTIGVQESGGRLRATPTSIPTLPASSGNAYRVVVSTRRTGGGIWNDSATAFYITCGINRVRVLRRQLWSGATWTWYVPAGTVCRVESFGENWTPLFQGSGAATVSFGVTNAYTTSRTATCM